MLLNYVQGRSFSVFTTTGYKSASYAGKSESTLLIVCLKRPERIFASDET